MFLNTKISICRLVFILILLSMMGNIAAEENRKTLTFGVVPQYSSTLVKKNWDTVLDILAKKTGYNIVLKASPSIPDFEYYLSKGKFDFAYINPAHALHAYDQQGFQPIVRDIKTMLQGILVVKKDNPITDIKLLNNRTLVFPSPNAFGASILLKSELARDYETDVESRYVKTHSSVYLNVALGEVIAGGGVEQTLAVQPQAVRDKVRVLYRTRKTVGHPIVIHPRVKKNVRKKLTEALISLNTTASGQSALNTVNIKEIGSTSIQEYLPLRTHIFQPQSTFGN